MSPGMMTSRNHGGFGPRFHGHGYGRIAPPTPRTYFPPHQRFSVNPNATGGTSVTLDETESMLVGTDENGAVTITIGQKPEPGNGNGAGPGNGNGTPQAPQQLAARRSLYGRVATKMTITSNTDGEVVISPGPDGTLQIIGDPETDVVAVVELVPQPLATPSEPPPAAA